MRKRFLLAFSTSLVATACHEVGPEPVADTDPEIFTDMTEYIPGPMFAAAKRGERYAELRNASKIVCPIGPQCEVWIYPKNISFPIDGPIFEDEVDRLLAIYKLDRSKGTEEFRANCSAVLNTPDGLCL